MADAAADKPKTPEVSTWQKILHPWDTFMGMVTEVASTAGTAATNSAFETAKKKSQEIQDMGAQAASGAVATVKTATAPFVESVSTALGIAPATPDSSTPAGATGVPVPAADGTTTTAPKPSGGLLSGLKDLVGGGIGGWFGGKDGKKGLLGKLWEGEDGEGGIKSLFSGGILDGLMMILMILIAAVFLGGSKIGSMIGNLFGGGDSESRSEVPPVDQKVAAQYNQPPAPQTVVDKVIDYGSNKWEEAKEVVGIPSSKLTTKRVLDWTDKLDIPSVEKAHNLDNGLLSAVMHQESGGRQKVVSGADAGGLMQFIPGTAKRYDIDRFDPAQSVDGAARYLQDLQKQFNNRSLALAGYNWGEGRVQSEILAKGLTIGNDGYAVTKDGVKLTEHTVKAIKNKDGNGTHNVEFDGPIPSQTRKYVASINAMLPAYAEASNAIAVAKGHTPASDTFYADAGNMRKAQAAAKAATANVPVPANVSDVPAAPTPEIAAAVALAAKPRPPVSVASDKPVTVASADTVSPIASPPVPLSSSRIAMVDH